MSCTAVERRVCIIGKAAVIGLILFEHLFLCYCRSGLIIVVAEYESERNALAFENREYLVVALPVAFNRAVLGAHNVIAEEHNKVGIRGVDSFSYISLECFADREAGLNVGKSKNLKLSILVELKFVITLCGRKNNARNENNNS